MRSIKLQVTTRVGAGVLAAFVALMGFILWFVRQELMQVANGSAQSLAQSAAREVDTRHATLEGMVWSLHAGVTGTGGGDRRRQVSAALAHNPRVSRVVIQDASGTLSLASHDGQVASEALPATEAGEVRDWLGSHAAGGYLVRRLGGKPVMAFAVPLPTGFLLAEGLPLDESLLSSLGAGRQAKLVVLDGAGEILAAPTAPLLGTKLPSGTPLATLIQKVTTGKEVGVDSLGLFDTGVPLRAFAAPIAHGGGHVVYFLNRDEALAGTGTMVAIVAALALVGLFLIGNILFIQIAVATAPLQDLGEACESVAKGDLEDASRVVAALEIKDENEVSRLRDAFRDMVADLKRANKELEIAARIQTALLPTDLTIQDYELSLHLVPASEVGGDLIDYIPGDYGRFWLAIGDVTGHGLTSGLITMMAQSIWFTLVSGQPDAPPSRLLAEMNARIYSNLQFRMRNDNYMTLQLVRHLGGGRFVASGLHLDILIYRAQARTVERVVTEGSFVGLTDDIASLTADVEFALGERDVMVLYTDGLIEAMDANMEQFDMHRLEESLLRVADQDAETIKDCLLTDVKSFLHVQEDDISIVVLKRSAVGSEPPATPPSGMVPATPGQTPLAP
jgi:serine phosphatase RsbU (regulator of sigma subunit)